MILSVASLVGVKDHANLVEAIARARDLGVACQLEIVGDGPLRPALTAQVQRWRLADLVRFRGAIAHDRLADVYRAANLFVVSSRHEAQCLAALEAAASGVAVVGTKVGVIPDLAWNGRAVPTSDPASLVAAILSFLKNGQDQAGQSGDVGSRFASEFSVDACTDRFRKVYRAVATQHGT